MFRVLKIGFVSSISFPRVRLVSGVFGFGSIWLFDGDIYLLTYDPENHESCA